MSRRSSSEDITIRGSLSSVSISAPLSRVAAGEIPNIVIQEPTSPMPLPKLPTLPNPAPTPHTELLLDPKQERKLNELWDWSLKISDQHKRLYSMMELCIIISLIAIGSMAAVLVMMGLDSLKS